MLNLSHPTPHSPLPVSLFLGGLLLPGDGALAGTFTRAGIRMRPLAAHRQTAAMAHAAVAVDLHQTLDVESDVLAQIAFDLPLVGDDLADLAHVVLGEILDARVFIDRRLAENVERARTADAVDVREADFDPLVQWKVHTCDTCHWLKAPSPAAAYVSESRK